MCDTNDKLGLLSSSHDLFFDFFPPPYTTVIVPQEQQPRRQQDNGDDSEERRTAASPCNDRKLKIRLLLLIVVAILSLLAIVTISLQLIVRHLETGQQLPATSSLESVEQLTHIGGETVIEIQLLGQEESDDTEETAGRSFCI